MRVAVLGGSSVASVQLAEALSAWPERSAERPILQFALHGRDHEKLGLVGHRFAATAGPAVETECTTDLDRALEGADVVLVQVRIGGMQARRFDESFPWRAGLPGEETLGPGGFANALRTLRALDAVWDAAVRHCPDAAVLVLTNPAGLVRQAAARRGLRAIEVCESPIVFASQLAERLGRASEDVAARYCGMNHVGWYVPRDEAELDQLVEGQAVACEVVQALGAVPLGYVRFYLDADRIYEAQQGKPTRAEQLMEIERDALKRLSAGLSPAKDARPAPWYRLGVVPALAGLAHGLDEPMMVGVRNGERVPELPAEATVEGLVRFAGDGQIEPRAMVELPPLPRTLLVRHAVYEQLALEAAQTGEATDIRRALLANPMVATAGQASVLTELLAPIAPSFVPAPAGTSVG